jgi:choline dehydrogenase-like flavoprotein
MSVDLREAGGAGDPGGQLHVFADYDRDFHLTADAVVVGSGPCGAVAAYELALAGKDVVLLEEGPPIIPDEYALDGAISMTRLMREAGLRTTRGTIMFTMQAICLGGGSLVNSAMCIRPPDFIFERWCGDYELGSTSGADLRPHFDAVGDFLGIAPTPADVLGPRNELFARGCDALGYQSEATPRNVRHCVGSGECFTGCRARAKQSMDISYVPAAMKLGARVLTSVQVQRVLTRGARAVGVEGQVVAPFSGARSHRFRVEAREVVLATGVVATPVLLNRSGNLANESGQVGENLQFHPGVSVMGIFPDRTHPRFGATQGYQSLQFLPEGFKMEVLWAPPAVTAVRLPGMGHDFKKRLGWIPYAAVFDAIISTKESTGRVKARRHSLDPVLQYRLHPADARTLQYATHELLKIFFAAGAHTVLPGVSGLPDEMTSLEQAEVLATAELRPSQFTVASTHVFSTTRMHGDPRRGVVDETGRAHGMDGLSIVDTGIFPRSPGVNPMYTGMALAHRAAGAIAERL